MDISMPGMNGIEAMRHLIQNNPKVKVIMLSMYSSGPLVRSVLAAGASGYVMKGSDFAELAAAIRSAT
jgi:two-component system invasion response regulator UvrY